MQKKASFVHLDLFANLFHKFANKNFLDLAIITLSSGLYHLAQNFPAGTYICKFPRRSGRGKPRFCTRARFLDSSFFSFSRALRADKACFCANF